VDLRLKKQEFHINYTFGAEIKIYVGRGVDPVCNAPAHEWPLEWQTRVHVVLRSVTRRVEHFQVQLQQLVPERQRGWPGWNHLSVH
jgi:hypothetical protein